jgi:endonuclease/exonuclease/phosphatase (EEP) superfamily protein YafD
VITFLVGSGTILSLFGQFHPLLELTTNLRLQYLLLLGIGVLILLVYRNLKLSIIIGALILANLSYVAPLYLALPPSPSGPLSSTYRALLLNVHYENGVVEDIIRLVRTTNPDIIVFLETTPEWMAGLASLEAEYPFVESSMRDDPGSIALFSRVPLAQTEIYDFGVPERPVIVAYLRLDKQPLTVVGFHPYPFLAGGMVRAGDRLEQLEGLARFVKVRPTPVIVLADFNFTPWSPLHRKFLRETGLRDAQWGFGVQPTWPAYYPPMFMPIDCAFVSAEIAVLKYEIGPYVGSDHFPVIIDFAIKEGGLK